MKIAVFVTIWATQASTGDLRDYFLEQPLAFLANSPEVVSVDLFVHDAGDIAFADDSEAPTLIVQVDLQNIAAAEALVQSDDFRQLVITESAYPSTIDKLSLDIVEPMHFPLPEQGTPSERTAGLSFLVRYYGPTDDPAAFAQFYTDNHPPILATFPGIRNVLCYLPIGWQASEKMTDDSLIIINEVVFDDLAALNHALESDVMVPLRADGKKFSKFGYNTHHAMLRERVYLNNID